MSLYRAFPETTIINISNFALYIVEKLCYLGSNLTESESLVSKLDPRIGKAAFFVCRKLLSSLGKPAPPDSGRDPHIYDLCVLHAPLRL